MEAIILLFFGLSQIFVFFGTGYMAWQWTTPESFMGVVGFLLLWSIIEYLAYNLIALLFSIWIIAEEEKHRRNNQ